MSETSRPPLITGIPQELMQPPQEVQQRPEAMQPVGAEAHRLGVIERSKNVFGKLFTKLGIGLQPVAETDNFAPLTTEERGKIEAIERMPVSYMGTEAYGVNLNIARHREKGPLRGVLESLRQELVFGGSENKGPLEHGYRIVRNIADVKFSKMDTSRRVIGLLGESKSYSRPAEYDGFQFASATEGGSLGWHSESRRSIGMTREHWLQESDQLLNELKSKGIELHHEGDHQLIAFMNTLAHETGHNVLSGISGMLRNRISSVNGSTVNMATSYFLLHNPNKAMTGNWTTDVKTHEERFSEGYAGFVMDSVLDALGYDKKAKSAIFAYFWDKTMVTEELAGHHAVDLLDKVGAEASISQVAKEMGIEDGVVNEGALGYTTPLTPQEMLDQMLYLDGELRDPDELSKKTTTLDAQAWQATVRSTQDEETKKVIQSQQQIRSHALTRQTHQNSARKQRVVQRKIHAQQTRMYRRMQYEKLPK